MRKENPFSKQEYEARWERVGEQMEQEGLDLLLVFDPANQFYLSGYQTVNQDDYRVLLLPRRGTPLLLLWQLEEKSAEVTTFIERRTYGTGEDPLQATIHVINNCYRRRQGYRLGLEDGAFLSISAYQYLARALPGAALTVCCGMVEKVRTIKSKAEMEQLRQAGKITQEGMRAAVDACKIGNSENDVAAKSLAGLFGAGSELTAFGPVVSSGWRSGIPHISNRRRKLGKNETVLIELGGCYNRYTAPLMRTVYLGKEVPAQLQLVEDRIRKALAAILRALGPGVPAEDIAKIGGQYLPPAEFPTIFHYVYGYSVGISFPPTWADRHGVRLRRGNKELLKPGMVFHLPMSIRIPGEYCVGISETALITDNGCERLTGCGAGSGLGSEQGLIIKEGG